MEGCGINIKRRWTKSEKDAVKRIFAADFESKKPQLFKESSKPPQIVWNLEIELFHKYSCG